MQPAHGNALLLRVQPYAQGTLSELPALSTEAGNGITLGIKYWRSRISHCRVCFFCNRLQEKNLAVALLNSSKCFGVYTCIPTKHTNVKLDGLD